MKYIIKRCRDYYSAERIDANNQTEWLFDENTYEGAQERLSQYYTEFVPVAKEFKRTYRRT